MKSVSDIPVLILCGGLGTRLGARSKTTPKCLVEVNGRPFLQHQLDWLLKQGIQKVLLCVGHHGIQVFEHFGTSYQGLNLLYSIEGEKPRGKSYALKNALPWISELEFFVLNGDTYLFGIDLSEVWSRLNSQEGCYSGVLLATHCSCGGGNLYIRGGQIEYTTLEPAPGLFYKDAGLILARRPFCLEPGDFPGNWVKGNKVLAFTEHAGKFVDMGTPQGILELEEQLKLNTETK